MARLDAVSRLVQRHLGMPDADSTLARFLENLYASAGANAQLLDFTAAVHANGGDAFPAALIGEVYQELSRELPKDQTPKIESRDLAPSEPHTSAEPHTHNTNKVGLPRAPTGANGTKEPSEASRNGLGTNSVNHNKDSKDSNKSDEPRDSRRLGLHPKTSPTPTINHIYKGYVSNLANYGAFIRLHSPTSFVSGLCHVSQLLFDGQTRIRHPLDVLKNNQQVYVRVTDIKPAPGPRSRDKISLSMVGVDQVSGADKLDEVQHEKRGRTQRPEPPAQKRRRLTSPERWEIQQLIAAGVASAADYPELNATHEDFDAPLSEVSVDVELNTAEPAFLKGRMDAAALLQAPAIIKNPTGSLSRAAMSGSQLAAQMKKERLQQSRQQARETRGGTSGDPMADLAGDLDAKEKAEGVITEWRRKQLQRATKKHPQSIPQQRRALPVFSMRLELVQSIRDNQFLVVVGETGSGKTTQIVQYIYEDHLNVVGGTAKVIGCTQPRRVAAVSVAQRVAAEVGCKVGTLVGYNIRFEDVTSDQTQIKFMTDGMLQREALLDPTMLKYSVIMLDEAHERTIATDVLFTLLKTAAGQNPDLKVIVTSATLDADKFSGFFNDCPILKIAGRTYPVEVLFSREPEQDYLAAALDCVMQIHVSEADGDILVFLTGQEEIDTSAEALAARVKLLGAAVPELVIVPVYSALPSEMQSKIFEPAPPGARKVVLATNIAETSITIDGIKYVVDPGFVKLNAYDPRLGMDSLVVSPISRAQANQRSGRAGRTGPGKCFRLYTEAAFNTEMLANTVPEIQRQNLATTILMLKAMGIHDMLNFEFMDPPPQQTMLNALHELYTLDALDDNGVLTALGRRMAEFPMEPALAKTVLASVDHECTVEVLTIVAMLSVQNVFYRPKEKQAAADQRKQRFHSIHGDHLTLLNVFKAWESSGFSRRWCTENYIHERSMRRAQDVKRQLEQIMDRFRYDIRSNDDTSAVRKAFCAGYFRNLAKRDPHEGSYSTLLDHTPAHMHPSLALYGKSVEFVVYHALLLTTKEYMHCASAIDSRWLLELAPRFFKKSDPLSERRKQEKIVPLFNRFADDQNSWRLTAQIEAKKKALGELHQ